MLSNACSQIHWGHFVCVPLASSYHTALSPVSPSLNCPELAKDKEKNQERRPSSATQSHENKHKVSHQVTRPSYLSFWWSPYQGWRQCWISKDPRGWNPQTEKKHSKAYVFSDAKFLLSWADTISGQVFKQTDCSWRHFPQQHMTALETTWHQIHVWSAPSV